MSQRALIRVFQFASERHTMGDARHGHLMLLSHLAQVKGGSLTFDRRVGSDDRSLTVIGVSSSVK